MTGLGLTYLRMPDFRSIDPASNGGRIVWLKKKGDKIAVGDVVGEVDVGNFRISIESTVSGSILKVLVSADEFVVTGLGIFEINAEHPYSRYPPKPVSVIINTGTNANINSIKSLGISANKPSTGKKVFIVHGHDDAAKYAVSDFLRIFGLEPVILHDKPNKGRTIITKFKEETEGVGFAIILMTPDDQGAKSGEEMLRLRARQNVIFELGFFIGKLGSDKVAALVKGSIERPSDFDGVVYISMDEGGGWREKLGRELAIAGFDIDWNKVMKA